MADFDSLKEESKNTWGGKREGAGRVEGSKNKATLEQQEVKKAFVERVNRNADKLFNAQLDLAIGEKYLMVIRTVGTGAKQRRETEVVTDPELIKQYLDEELDNTDEEYYFMSTKPANNQALEGLLNRSFGKATDKIEMELSGEVRTGEMDPKVASKFAEYLKRETKS